MTCLIEEKMPSLNDLVRAERREIVRSIVRPYMVAKKDSTMDTMQYSRLKTGPDNRIRTVLSSIGTETSRLSSSKSFLEPSTNLQNISKSVGFQDDTDLYRVRDVFIADEDMLFWANDYEKAEAVMAAAYSQDWDFYEKLHAGEDVHTWHAAHFFGHDSMDQVTKIQRLVAKMITYSSNYMIKTRTLTIKINNESDRTGVKLKQKEVGRLKREYLDLHPLEEWWANVRDRLDSQGYITNALGLKRYFYNPNDHKRLKEALAFLPQSTVAQAINIALMRVYEELDEDGVFELLLQVHDELMGQGHHSVVEERARRVKEIMEHRFQIHGHEVFIPAGIAIGKRWGSHRKSDPEDDERLREIS